MKSGLPTVLRLLGRSDQSRYWIELAVLENTLLALDPISRIVPTTRTRITASITAYSAISCPSSSDQILRINSAILSLQSMHLSPVVRENCNRSSHNAAAWSTCQLWISPNATYT